MERERNRQTGRTTRIVNYVVEQLLSHGECIATDHIAYEFKDIGRKNLSPFIEKIERRIHDLHIGRPYKFTHKFINTEEIILVHFRLDDLII